MLDAAWLMPLAVCATPIGNLEDVTLRVLAELRRSRGRPLRGHAPHADPARSATAIAARLSSYHEHNEAARTAELLPRLDAGERVALVSDAGLPGISDPGARLVAAALEAGVPVTVLPGPRRSRRRSSRAGSSAERYQFVGYPAARRGVLAALWEELRGWPWPAVAFESPRRLPASLRSLAAALPEREVAVCRELTKRFEEVVRGHGGGARGAVRRAAEGRDHARARGRGRRPRVRRARRLRRPSAELVACRRRRAAQAAEIVSRLTGASRNAPLPRLSVTKL